MDLFDHSILIFRIHVHQEMKGVPLRIELGPMDISKGAVLLLVVLFFSTSVIPSGELT